MNQNNSLNFDRSNRKSNLFLNKPLNLYDDNFIPRSSTEVLNPNLINHDLNVFDEEDESDFLYNSLNYNLKSENISDPDQDGGIRDVFAKNIPKTILDQDLMSLYHQNNCDIEGGVSTTNKIDNLNLFNLFNDNPIKNESLLNDSYLSNSSNPKIVPSSLLINPFQNDMPFNSSQSSSNKLSDDDDDNNISSIIKINKYGEKKSSIDRNGGNHSMNKEWLKGKLKNIKQKKVKRFHKKKSSSSQSTLTFNNFEKECLDKLSPISDPLISLSAMSLAKPVRDSDLKEIPSSHLSLDSITSENISKSKINLHHHYTDKVLGEKEGSFSYFGFENTLINNEKDNHDLVENTENVDKNGGPNDTKKNNDKGKNSRNLSKNKNEIILSSHIKNNINLGQMKLTMNNDPEIIHDTTSSFLFILEDADLWKKFNSVVNEMIITKSGRCLFPILKFQPINLEPKVQYSFAIDILQASPYKYKYRDKKWISGGIKFFAPPTQKKEYYHPDSPQSGHFWMTHGVSFSKIKLTNHIKSISENGQSTKKSAMLEEYNDTINGNNDDNNNSSNDNKEIIVKHKSTKLNVINSIARLPENHFYLSSFFMYEPCLYLIRHDADKKYVSTIKFNETKFLAVTHYQNEKVNQLKKNYNPHAKGFKDDLYKTKKRNRKEKKKSKSGEEEDKQQKYPSHLLNESINETDACYKSLIKEYENYNTPMPQKNSRISISENYFKGNENTMMTLNLSEINRKETIGLPKHSYKRKLVKKKYQTNKDGKTPHFFNKLIGNLGNDNYKISKTFQKSSKESFDHHYHHHHQHHQYSIHPLFINDDKNNSLESSKESWLKNKETVLTMPSQLSMEVTPSTISLLNSTTKSKSPNLDFSSLLLLPNQDSLMDNTLNYNDQFNDALMVENIDLDGLLKTTTIPSLPSPFNEPNNTTTINPFNDTTTISNNNDNNDNSNGERNKNNNSSTDFNINDTFLLNKDNTFTLIDDSKSNKENMEDLSPSLNLLLNMNNYMSNQTERDQKI
ncbi:hypothetical protein BCR36DRAFT_284583 [Piromyces finnis]|uniref:T-box domain-containing protein n=1 Tax=Piromyces finnis TaxID=1754191 RepID=A0A1Y1VE39_9FUNG|nr:hypothetical protein BCR36DRAFT_284583 [Piromyces finnis]|eukprot:ORX53847.1 hypothetical protein BCR36DRAFT_284583 [Piromyces finnis]